MTFQTFDQSDDVKKLVDRHDIYQNFYATGVFGVKLLHKTRELERWQIRDKTA